MTRAERGNAYAYALCRSLAKLIRTLSVACTKGMPSRWRFDAERRDLHSQAERGNEGVKMAFKKLLLFMGRIGPVKSRSVSQDT